MATVKINELEIRRLRVGSRITDTAIEKAAALEKLAAHVERITKAPPPAARARLRIVAG
jgi:hypothetical protein